MSSGFESDPILVEVTRGDVVESVHRGRVAVTGPDGELIASIGEPFAPIYPRSSLKPLQAVGMLRAGLDLDGALLALASASHSGEPFHLDGVREVLSRSDLDVDALQTPPDYPLDDEARTAWIASGRGKEPLAMNCSGKHAGMLRTAVLRGDDPTRYRDPGQPVQTAIVRTIDDLAGQQAQNLTVDGCGAPLWSIELYGLARAFGRIAQGAPGTEEGRVAEAIRAHPEFVSGTHRDEVELHRAVPGLIGKGGAEAVHAVGLPDGRGVALKIADGGARGRAALMAAVLNALGYDDPILTAHQQLPTLGHGEPVGVIRPVADLAARLRG
ncbi:L-asparaginase II [Friedmanniella endophytica]|uniref:L-asparaginase II n=1 Tax=Microlunatus kandeliicorticis TaxID=1759536 RepID=A0A7W3IVX6_9ACTN|nr:asparaginase [Microlunatus kandeliicorticis]MBA8796232.1 L-asparaginase II [Microlunatus kandeliicorticis]